MTAEHCSFIEVEQDHGFIGSIEATSNFIRNLSNLFISLLRLFSLSRLEGYGRETEVGLFGASVIKQEAIVPNSHLVSNDNCFRSLDGNDPTSGRLDVQYRHRKDSIIPVESLQLKGICVRSDLEIGLIKFPTLCFVEIALPVLVKVIPPIEMFDIISLRVLNGWKPGGAGAGAGAEAWFFLSKSNARTISLSSATSDETAWVEEFVLTLATTALARV
ncbi:hypothetical protein Tco_0599296 [Tanacetum coccineum]